MARRPRCGACTLWLGCAARGKSKRWLHSAARCGSGSHKLSGQSWLTLKWQWREFTVSGVSGCHAGLNWWPGIPLHCGNFLESLKLPFVEPQLFLLSISCTPFQRSSHSSLRLHQWKHWLQCRCTGVSSYDHRNGRHSTSNGEPWLSHISRIILILGYCYVWQRLKLLFMSLHVEKLTHD